ncbi:MAG: Flp family type IVb pilin [Sphingomonadaceae bacterium]
MNAIKNFIQDEAGVTAIEYALIAALVAAAITVGAGALGTAINAMFTKVAGLIK